MWIKQHLAFILIVLISIENSAAVVSDNDGASFITKAEFDSMKNDFQATIDQYNTSLDNKINSAISSYLAGAKSMSQVASPILVDNYEEMMWQNGWQLYGMWKTFTNRDTFSYQNTNAWCYPNLNQKRHYIRETNLMVWDHWQDAYSSPSIGLKFKIMGADDGIYYGTITTTMYNNCVGVPILHLVEDSEGWYIDHDHPIWVVQAMAPYLVGHTHDANGGTEVWFLGEGGRTEHKIHDVSFRVPDNRIWLDYRLQLYLNYDSSGAPNPSNWWFDSQLNVDNSDWPVMWYSCNEWLDRISTSNLDSLNRCIVDDVSFADKNITNFINGGCTAYAMADDKAKQIKSWKCLMLGRATESEVRISRYKRSDGERYICDQTGIDDAGTLKCTLAYTTYSLPIFRGGYKEFKVAERNDISRTGISIKVPYWPKEKLKNQTTHYFKYNNGQTSLKFGQGLPLRLNNDANGYLQIRFDYDVMKILDDASQNKKIYIDIKKDDFNSSGTEYVKGYTSLVDPSTTTETSKTFNRLVIDTTDGKANLTLPMKKGENFWLRISPYDDTLGLYAHMENLNMTMIYN